MTILKDTQLDTVVSLISHIAENVDDNSIYDFIVSKYSIQIYDKNQGRYVLSIDNPNLDNYESIRIADYFSDEKIEASYRSLLKEHNEKYSNSPNKSAPMNFPSERRSDYLKFVYFYSEAEWFQKMTVLDNVLPYECTWHINTIRNKVIDYISFHCGGFTSREEYENSYER